MLGKTDIEFIYNNYKIYDHNWEFYASLLGEPFLINDCLIYFDGKILYVCAFSLINPKKPVNIKELLDKLSTDKRFETAEILDVWGNFTNNQEKISWKGFKPIEIAHTNKIDSVFDSIIFIDNFNYSNNKKARLAKNAAENKKVYTKIVKRDYLTSEHIKIMKKFLQNHNIQQPHLSFFLSIQFIIRSENAVIIESYNNSENLIGFSVIMHTSQDSLTYLLACYDNCEKRAADATLAKCIEYCKASGIKRFHMGYSGSDSLLDFKKKWGASSSGLSYEEVFYKLSDSLSDINENTIFNGNFLWRDRFFLEFNLDK